MSKLPNYRVIVGIQTVGRYVSSYNAERRAQREIARQRLRWRHLSVGIEPIQHRRGKHRRAHT